MSILSTEQISHSFSDRWLFSDLNFSVQRGDRIALVGINGTGKSTLLKILAGILEPNEGIVVREKGIRVGFLEQEPNFESFITINDFIYSPDNKQQFLIGQYEQLNAQANPDKARLEQLVDEISALNAWEYEYNIKTILNRLNISEFGQEIETLSGGQRKRLALAKLLIDEPDVYILDEPTNHLDIETIEWLEKLLTTGHKTVLLVSHDRYFLDSICSEIRELDRGKLYFYPGNYARYLEKKAEREGIEGLLAEKSRNLLRKELEWMRRQPKARGTKSKSRIAAFYDLESKATRRPSEKSVKLDIIISRQGNRIINIDRIKKNFGHRVVIEDFSYVFKKGDRIGLSGRNGSGKSTFLDLITGEIHPDSGQISIGETTVFGYYRQDGMDFDEQSRVIDVVKDVAEHITLGKGKTISASQLLTRFLFPPPKQHGLVSKLSGGEKKRLQLMRVLMKNPNVLILDEPTNDLDIDTLNVLEDFLEEYVGVLVLVSHDRYLIDKLVDQLFIFDGSGQVKIYNGNYADYKIEEELEKQFQKQAERNRQQTVSDLAEAGNSKKQKPSYKEILEFEQLDQDVTALEDKIEKMSLTLNEITDHIRLTEIYEEIAILKQSLEEKSNRWLELSELM